MPITAEERIERRKHIGGSDLAALLGLDPFRSAEDIRLEKSGKLIDQETTSDVMQAGTWLESGVLEFASSRLGEINMHPGSKAIPNSPIVVNTDGLLVAKGEPIEAKTAKLFGPSGEWWGDEGTDEIPDRVIVQCMAHLLAWPASVCHVPALIGGRGFVLYAVPFNQTIANVILDAAGKFWNENVLKDIPCEGSTASLQVVKMLKRTPNKVVGIDPDLVTRWLSAKEAKSAAEKAADQAQADMLAALQDAEAGQAGEHGAVTYLSQNRAGYKVEPTSYRVLRLKKGGL